MKKLRLAFMGTPEFAATALRALIDAGHDIVCVYSQPPKPSGRGHKVTKSAVQLLAEQNSIEVRTPRSLKNVDEQKLFADLDLDVAVVAAYGLILPSPILSAPRYGCINIHASLLPRWRGAAPIHRALLAGDNETGIAIMQMDAGLDTGDVLAMQSIPITHEAITPQLHDALAALGGRMIVGTLANIDALQPQQQPDDGVTYAHKLTKDESRVDWQKSAVEIDRQIRALNPWPGVVFSYNNETFKILTADIVEATGAPGTLLDQDFSIACGTDALRIIKIQRAGKAPAQGADFLRGFPIAAGTLLQ